MHSLTALKKTTAAAGGTLFAFRFRPLPPPQNGGCGCPMHVAGTNGGTVPCGNMLMQLDGMTSPYYCARCSPTMETHDGDHD